MTRPTAASRLNITAVADEGTPLSGVVPVADFDRLLPELADPAPQLSVAWQAVAERRPGPGDDASGTAIWLHLTAETEVPLRCQRCMGVAATPVQVNQWYRFVATEDIAMAEDDHAQEDLLVLQPQFDLLALLEDELLMALPLVPMHAQCPGATAAIGDAGTASAGADETAGRPNPFAVLAQIKRE